MTPPNTAPRHDRCLPCRRGRHIGCLWRDRFCGCLCPWVVADVLAHFPSLRAIVLEETQ